MVEHREPVVPFENGIPGHGPGSLRGPAGSSSTGRIVEVEQAPLASSGGGGPEQRVLGADVVEDAVEHERHTAVTAGFGEAVEGRVVAEPGVDAEVVNGVVSVGARGEDGSECQAVGA